MPSEQTAVPTVYAIDTENEMRLGRENKKSNREGNRCFMIMVTLLVVLFAALFATLFVLFRFMYPKTERSGNVCDSDDCVRMAAVFKKSMDPSVEPCDNFAKYACGKWSESYLKPDSYVEYSWFEYIHQRQTRKLRDLLRRNLTDVYGAKLPRAVLQAQKLYNSCVDTESQDELGLDPLVTILKKFNLPKEPPIFLDRDNSTDLIRQAARIKRNLYVDVFFKAEVYVDLQNVSRNLIVIGSPSSDQTFRSWSDYHDQDKIHKYLKLPRKDFADDEEDDFDDKLMVNLMTSVIREMISNNTDKDTEVCQDISEEEKENVDDLVQELMNMRDYIYKNGNSSDNETLDMDDTFEFDALPEAELMHVDALQKLTDDYVRTINPGRKPQQIWKPFIEELFKDILKPNWRTRYKLWVYDLKHLQRVALLLANTDKNLLESWTWWSVVETLVPYSSTNMHKFWTDYVQQMYDLENVNSRSFRCVSVVNNLMGIATSWLYFDEKFIQEDVSQIYDMVRYMKTAFADLVIKSDWIDRPTKIAILRKNSQPLAAIGYPEWLFMDKKLDELNSIKVNLSDKNLLANVFYILKSKVLSQLKTLTSRNSKDVETWVEPVVINAFHVYEKNQIIIPASILTFPFYTSSLKSVNYGFIGAGVIGHELAHGFDDLGRRFDEFGNYKQCWSNETIAQYVSKAQCFIQHYSGYPIEETESYVNGEATLNENLADALGLKQAFFGYQQWKERHEVEPKLSGFTNLTHEQLFFLSYAVTWCQTYTPASRRSAMSDEHAPMDVRILGTLRNSKEFSKAWQCPIGSYMNPEDKCSVW